MTKPETLRRAGAAGSLLLTAAASVARRRPLSAAALMLAGAAAARGAFAPGSPIFGRVPTRGANDAPRVALTFDDGPGPSTGAVLDALAEAEARATFFVLGRQVERHPDLVERIVADGHQVACHGYDHGILVFRGAAHVRDQIERTERAVAGIVGSGALSADFRAPHGFRGPLTVRAARSLGYRTVGWTVGVFDSADPGADVVAERAIRALDPGAILLLHDADGWAPDRDRSQTAQAVGPICAAARGRGLELVRLDEMHLP